MLISGNSSVFVYYDIFRGHNLLFSKIKGRATFKDFGEAFLRSKRGFLVCITF